MARLAYILPRFAALSKPLDYGMAPRPRCVSLRPMKDWWQLASQASVVKRACQYAVVVGAVLITINHGDAILAGDFDGRRMLKMSLTMAVPYLVSTFSSVGAIRQMQRKLANAVDTNSTQRPN